MRDLFVSREFNGKAVDSELFIDLLFLHSIYAGTIGTLSIRSMLTLPYLTIKSGAEDRKSVV